MALLKKQSILSLPSSLKTEEVFQTLLKGEGIRVEKIISNETLPSAKRYDQEEDEWVLVVSGSAILEDEEGQRFPLSSGEYIFIPRHVRHRVVSTTTPCIWLAIHGTFKQLI